MENIFKWGILGPGTIAHSFAQGLQVLDDAELAAVASYTPERGEAFAKQYEVPVCYHSYEELLEDSSIDIVYISALNPSHKKYSIMALRAGKHVLCEKPLALNEKDAEEIVKTAQSTKRFLMEGMWTRFLPVTVKLREWISEGLVGDIRQVKSDFCFRCEWEPSNRLLDVNLGGGALMDVGIYNISYANMIYGELPVRVTHDAYIGPTGVDEQSSAILRYGNGQIATIIQAVRTQSPWDAWVIGTEGYIHIPGFWHGNSATVYLDGKDPVTYDFPFEATGYNCEAQEVMRCIRDGKLESDILPHKSTLSTLRIMDGMRSDWGMAFPQDNE